MSERSDWTGIRCMSLEVVDDFREIIQVTAEDPKVLSAVARSIMSVKFIKVYS